MYWTKWNPGLHPIIALKHLQSHPFASRKRLCCKSYFVQLPHLGEKSNRIIATQHSDLVAIFLLQSAIMEVQTDKWLYMEVFHVVYFHKTSPKKLLCTGPENCLGWDLIKAFTREWAKIKIFITQEERMGEQVLFNANSPRHLVLHAKECGVKFTIIGYRSWRVLWKMQLLNKSYEAEPCLLRKSSLPRGFHLLTWHPELNVGESCQDQSPLQEFDLAEKSS